MLKAFLPTLLFAALSVGSSRITQATPLDLSQFQWKNRLLFLFAPNRSHPFFNILHKSFASQKEDVADRDLVIFEILESGSSSMNMNTLDPQTARSLRQKFDPPRSNISPSLSVKTAA